MTERAGAAAGMDLEIAPDWRPADKVLFRFAFCYFLLYGLPRLLQYLPYVEVLAKPLDWFWNHLVPWVAERFFGITITVFPNGSGDTTFNYVQVLCMAVLSLVATLLWTLLDRHRPHYRRLHDGLRVFLRLTLACTMITYGALKVIKVQFSGPTLDRLLQPFGDSSPMGLLWTFMAASESYNVFTGACEMLGGLLLISRRTTLLGALVSAAAMVHVAMLNFSYDVPVKLYSSHLLAMALFLVLPDARRLVSFLVLNRPVPASPLARLCPPGWPHRCAVGLRTALMLAFCAWSLYGAFQGRRLYGDHSPRSPLYGIWNVVEMEVDGVARPPLVTDTARWRRVVFDSPRFVSVLRMDDSRQRYTLTLDEPAQTMVLKKSAGAEETLATLQYQRTVPEELVIEGTLDGQQIQARLERQDPKDFLLLSRGFHWVSEYPFNR